MRNHSKWQWLGFLCTLLGACADDKPAQGAEPGTTHAGDPAGEVEDLPAGLTVQDDDSAVFRTERFELGAGEERYLCFAADAPEDLVIDGYSHAGQSFVHHVIFVRTNAPEPAGFSECDVLFRTSWDPLFLTGAGNSEISFPSGSGHKLAQGKQLMAQLHLLNTKDQSVSGQVTVDMHRSGDADPKPVGSFVFGTSSIDLPPKQSSSVESTCTLDKPVQLIAGFAHMHWLGRSLRFEAGPSADSMQTRFSRDPYDFDNQSLQRIDLTFQPGDVTRVTCNFDNPNDHSVGFGESTTSEMCFFVGMAVDQTGLGTCITRRPPADVPVNAP